MSRGRSRGATVPRTRLPPSHPYSLPQSTRPSRHRLAEGGYFTTDLRTRTRDSSLRAFTHSACPSPDLTALLQSELTSKKFPAYPLSDVRLLGVDTDEFPVFNAAVRPDQFAQYFLGVGWDNVQTVLTLRAVLPALAKLDTILNHFKLSTNSVPLTLLNHRTPLQHPLQHPQQQSLQHQQHQQPQHQSLQGQVISPSDQFSGFR